MTATTKFILTFVCCLSLSCSVIAQGSATYDVRIDDVSYKCDQTTKTASVVEPNDNPYRRHADIVIQQTISFNNDSYRVTKIGEGAFERGRDIRTVRIPDGIVEIGNNAFYGCLNLQSIAIPNSVITIGSGAFYDCTSLESVILPDSIKEISRACFFNCQKLASIKIPNSVTRIDNAAFFSCISLTSIEIPMSVTFIGEGAFCNLNDAIKFIYVPNKEAKIHPYALNGDVKITRNRAMQNVLDKVSQDASSTETLSDTTDWICRSGQKIYEGSFPFHDAEGIAKYQYILASDGTRIYDGNFEFRSPNFYAKGKFKNNYQIGEWVYQSKQSTATINFNQEGYLNGKFSCTNGAIKVNGACISGRVAVLGYSDSEFSVSGNTNLRERPSGTWHLRILSDPNNHYTYETNYRNKPMTVEFNTSGTCVNWYFTDPSTGDQKQPQRGDWTLNGPEGIMRYCIEKTKSLLSVVLLQKSIIRNGYQR